MDAKAYFKKRKGWARKEIYQRSKRYFFGIETKSQQVSHLINNTDGESKAQPSIETLVKIAEVLDVYVLELQVSTK